MVENVAPGWQKVQRAPRRVYARKRCFVTVPNFPLEDGVLQDFYLLIYIPAYAFAA